MKDLKEVVKPFYTKCLTVNEGTNTAEVMGKLLADNFQSLSSTETKGKAELTGQVQHLRTINWFKYTISKIGPQQ